MALKIKYKHTNNTWLKHQGYSLDEEGEVYDAQLSDVYNNPRWYLTNLDYLSEYKVRWKCYTHTPPSPTARLCNVNLGKGHKFK